MKIKVPIAGTVGKSVQFDPAAGARAEAAVAALVAQINAGIGGSIRHSSLLNLQVGDDHPQYTMWQAPETIVATWNFQAEPYIEGVPLTEFIEDVVGGELVQDTASITWTYGDTAGTLEANVVDEYIQDLVGAMLADTSSVDLSYNDAAGTFSAAIIDEYVQDLVGAMATDSTSIDFTYNDGAGTLTAAVIYANPSASIGLSAVNGSAATAMRSDAAPALSQAIAPAWTDNHTWADNKAVRLGTGADFALSHDGTDSLIQNNTGALRIKMATAQLHLWGTGTGATAQSYIGFYDSAGTRLGLFGDPSGSNRLLMQCDSGNIDLNNASGNELRVFSGSRQTIGADDTGTAGNTALKVYDVDNATLERVTVGAADSGGTGYKVLRIPN